MSKPPIVFGPARATGSEFEIGSVVLPSESRTRMNGRMNAAKAERHAFGLVVLNDWSGKSPYPGLVYTC